MNRQAQQRESESQPATPARASDRASRLQPKQPAGNFAVQRFVQASLRAGALDDPEEREAESVASAVTSEPCGGCSAAAPCASCSAKEMRLRRSAAPGASRGALSLPASQLARLGAGSPLGNATRARMQPYFGRDLSRVRIHTGSDAASAARHIQARAFTHGSDIVFDDGEFRPGSAEGDRLLAHELTHVAQNEGTAAPLRREVSGDIRTMSVDAAWAQRLTDPELEEQVGIVRGQLGTLSRDSDEYRAQTANLQVLEAEVRRRNPGETPSPEQDIPAQIPVNLTYELVGVVGGNGQPVTQLPPDVLATLGTLSGQGGIGSYGNPLALAAMGGFDRPSGAGSLVEGYRGQETIPGAFGASGMSLLRFLDPMPAGTSALRYLSPFASPAGPGANLYTRFAGPTTAEGLFTPPQYRLLSDLRPRFGSGTPAELLQAERLFAQEGVSYSQLSQLRSALLSRGVSGLTAEEAQLFNTVVRVHTQVAGATPSSPLLSLTQLEPAQALRTFTPEAGRAGIGTVTQRSYVVRVRINPADVAEANQVLGRARLPNLAPEMEVVVAQDLTRGAQIVSITRNTSSFAPLGGVGGAVLTWVGRGLLVIGAAVTVYQVATAHGPHQHQEQGSALGSFALGTAGASFAAGFCIGAGIATGGGVLLLCGLAGGLLGGGLGYFGGGAIGSIFD